MEIKANDEKSRALIAVTISFTFMSTVAVCMRLISRKLSSLRFWWDDGFIAFGLFLLYGNFALNILDIHYTTGIHEHSSSSDLIDVSKVLNKLFYAEEALYAVSITVIKTSVLLFYYRIFGVRPDVRKAIYALEALVTAWGVATFFTTIFQCTPVSAVWERPSGAHCVNQAGFLYGTAIPNTLVDIALLVLPLCVLWALHLDKKKKIGVSLVFSVGFVVCVLSVVRIWSVTTLDQDHITQSYVKPLIWSTVETNVGITCACLPTLQPLLNATLCRKGSSRRKDFKPPPSHSWPHDGRRLLSGRTLTKQFQRMGNNLEPLAVPSSLSNAWTSVGKSAVMKPAGHEMALLGTIHVKRDVDVEHEQLQA